MRDVISVIKRGVGGANADNRTAGNVLLAKGELKIVVIAENAVVAKNAEPRGDRWGAEVRIILLQFIERCLTRPRSAH